MSSAILYLAIIAIWAVVLVPRWLRHPHTIAAPGTESEVSELAAEAPAGFADDGRPAPHAPRPPETAPPPGPPADRGAPPQRPRAGPGSAPASPFPAERRARILRARRRTLSTLVLLAAGAVVLAVAHLAAWWVALPPGLMLAGFLLLLREAARIDAERAARRLRATQDDAARDDAARDGAGRDRVTQRPEPDAAAAGAATPAARAAQPGEAGWHEAQQPAAAQAAEPGADIIDISARISDQLYDQYTDAEARAIGD